MDGYQKFFLKAKLNSGATDGDRRDSISSTMAPAEEMVLAELRSRETKGAAANRVRSEEVSRKRSSPEERLKLAIAQKSKRRRAGRGLENQMGGRVGGRASVRSIPRFAAMLSAAALMAASAGVATTQLYPEAAADLDELRNKVLSSEFGQSWSRIQGQLSRIQIGVFGFAQAADAKTPAAQSAVDSTEKAAASASSASSGGSSSANSTQASVDTNSTNANTNTKKKLDVRQWTEEELSFFEKLNERKEALDRREAELAKLEEELQRQKGELDQKIKKLEAMRAEISETLKERVVQDQEKVAKLVDFYSNMKPSQAAKVIENLNEDLAVAVLDRMKKKNAADILNMMSSEKAKALSEMLTGYRAVGQTERELGGERKPAAAE